MKIKQMSQYSWLVLSTLLAFPISPVAAETLVEGLQRVMVEHNLMKAVTHDVAAAKEEVDSEKSSWLPRLTVRGAAGFQDITRDLGANGSFNPTETNLGVNQLIWDFGTTNTIVERSEKNLFKEEQEYASQRINLILASIEAYLKLQRAMHVHDFALQSEENVQKQTTMELARVEMGKGLTTDHLQAKVQLSGAKARRVSAMNTLEVATNRYRAVFGPQHLPNSRLAWVKDPAKELPASLNKVLELSETTNPDVLAARARVALAQTARDVTRNKEYMPRIDLQLDKSHKREFDGVDGSRRDFKSMVQFNWGFDTGLKASHATQALTHQAESEQEKATYVVIQAQEEARNAWSDLLSSRERQTILHEQVGHARQFLELARLERENGKRSLLDVLNGENNLINAQSDAATADIDTLLAAFRVLRAAGLLDLSHVKMEEKKQPSSPKAASTAPSVSTE
ncbi:MAG: TolC family protein, partial [Magnetococcales bacterium]|nr:TolC family protein [Magnetococcales bacterium]